MLHQQAISFVFSVVAGFAAGFIFDVYQVIRRLLRLRKVGTAVGDVLAWLIVAFAAFGLLILGNWAELRLYVVMALAFGLTVYIKVFSRWTKLAVYKIFLGIAWTVRTAIRALVLPFRILLKVLSYPLIGLKWLCLLVVRLLEYAFSFPQMAVQRFFRDRNQIPPEL